MRKLALLFLAAATTLVAIPPDRIPPSTPSGLTATAPSCHQVDLAWTGSTDNVGGSGLRGYRIYRGSIFVIEVSVTSFSQMDLAGGTNYSYTVSAIDKAGNESPSTPSVSVSTPKCPPGYCNYVLLPGWYSTGPQPESDDINVLTGTNCAWTVISSAPWLTATPTSGTGPGWITWNSATNSSTAERRATLTIGGKTFTLVQVGNANNNGTNGQLKWVKGETTCAGSVNGVTADHAGNVIAVGQFEGTIDFGNGPINSTGYIWDIFVVKYSPSGALLWAKTFGGLGNDAAQSVSVDSLNNIIVTGYFSSTANLGGISLVSTGETDAFVAKYSPSGALVWAKGFGGIASDSCGSAAVDANDNIVLAVAFSYSINFGTVSLSCAYGSELALAKFSPAGSLIWAKGWGDPGTGICNTVPHSMAIDHNGDIVVTGEFSLPTNLGGGIISAPTYNNLFVAKYSGADGSYRWAKGTGSSGDNRGYGIATDPNTGNVIVTGVIQGTVDLGNGSVTATGPTLFLAGYNPIGSCLWTKIFANLDSYSTGFGSSVAVDTDGTIALTGQLFGTVNCGPGVYLSVLGGDKNFFMATLLPSGNTAPVYRWGKTLSGSGISIGNTVTFDSASHVLTAGTFRLTKDFGGTSLTGASVGSAFTAQYNK